MIAVLVTMAIPTGIYAYMSVSSNKEENKFIGGSINAAVMENGQPHENSKNNVVVYEEVKNAGDSVDKVVSIKNLANGEQATSMYARVRLIPSIVAEDGSIMGTEVKISYEFEKKTNWKVKDSTYYYTKQIAPNEESEVLLKKVTIKQDIPDGYHLELKVIADAIVTRPDTILESTWGIKKDFSDMTDLK